jgi:alpha-N-arabinofuranosidase
MRTPNYHVFDMYKEHQNGTAVRAVFAAPMRGKLPGLDGSASVQGQRLVLTCTNTDEAAGRPVTVRLEGGTAKTVTAVALSGKPQAHNTFAEPELVKPVAMKAEVRGGAVVFEMPAASVARVMVELG